MLNLNSALWHYLGSFILYTMGAIGLIYVVYWYTRRQAGSWLTGAKKDSANKLSVESSLTLEPRKTLYVVRSGQERFLVAASADTTQLLSKLEDAPLAAESKDAKHAKETAVPAVSLVSPVAEETPWYAEQAPKRLASSPGRQFAERLVESVRWLASSRGK